MSDVDPTVQTSATDERGRTLTGVGVSADALETTMDRHAPEPPSAPAPQGPAVGESSSSPKPTQTRGQARFSELTQARKDAEAKAEAAEKKAAELEARLAQQPPRETPKPQESAHTPPPSPVYTRPEPSEDDIGDKYPTYAAFTRAQAEWVWEQQQAAVDQRIRQGIEADRAAQAFDRHVEATRAKGRAVYKDFDTMLSSGPGAFVDMPMPAVHAILNHPQSEHLQYKIMADGATAQRLAQIAFRDPYAFAFELAKLAPSEPPSNGSPRPHPAPPAPMTPVGSGSRSSLPTSAEHAEAGHYEQYKAARAAERRSRR